VDANGKDVYGFGNGGVGGGIVISNNGSASVLNNVTVTNNTSGRGGGIYLTGSNNATATNTIIANNQSTNQWGQAKNCTDAFKTAKALIEFPRLEPGGGNACAADPLDGDPKLAGVSLADNGGPTPTLMPPATSSAFKIGASCEANDQRGISRAARCDAGAVFISP